MMRVERTLKVERTSAEGVEAAGQCTPAAIAQWHSRLNACVRVNGGHFEHKFWASDFQLCFVCFVNRLLVALNVIDINTCKVLISCEMCYFCVWDFHTVWQQHNKCMARNFYANDFGILLRSCARLWKSVNISKSYSKKNQWHLFFLDTVYNRIFSTCVNDTFSKISI